MLGHVLGLGVTEPGCLGSAGTGNDSYQRTDNRRHNNRTDHPFVFLFCNLSVILDFCSIQLQRIQTAFWFCHNLNQSEQTNQTHSQIHTKIQTADSKGKTVIAGHRIGTDTGNEQTQAGRNQTADNALSGHTGNNRKSKYTNHEILGSSQLCCHSCNLRP